ncbi:hypothetical protein J5N97_027510 [Dioscorea zingiberensis]|uniref:Uncharacterized protein n=1 Tax=Dioscorea zingiberensis TaxID=325984 RepID=A0A9D5C5D6_9LILI|nr:hypothetical protein J5N97_027510 [Dioscorea zingiberensis]
MGSLMAGWASPSLDPEKERLERNKSLTKVEIEAFLKSYKKNKGDDHEKEINSNSQSSQDCNTLLEHENKETSDWWTKSNWAFLNEPCLKE